MSDLTAEQVEALVAAAREVRKNAYAPYSGYAVGAAILSGPSGAIFTGANVENASYGLAICAERSAVVAAIAAGERQVRGVAVVAGSDDVAPPCGACRQVLFEFGPDMLVVSESPTGAVRKQWRLAELLPAAFGPENLR